MPSLSGSDIDSPPHPLIGPARVTESIVEQAVNELTSTFTDEAETMEHFLTPEIEGEILRELGLCSRFNPLLEIHEIVPDPDIV